MATISRLLIRSLSRRFSTTVEGAPAPNHRNNHLQIHKFMEPDSYLGSWNVTKNPKEAERKLAHLRRDYAKKVKETRKQYIEEMELLRLEKQRKDEARKEAIRIANEERKKLKAEAAKVRAEERKVAQEEFRQTLLKERVEKLENWKMKERQREEKKQEKGELVRRQSSMWVDERELEKKILDALIDVTPL